MLGLIEEPDGSQWLEKDQYQHSANAAQDVISLTLETYAVWTHLISLKFWFGIKLVLLVQFSTLMSTVLYEKNPD